MSSDYGETWTPPQLIYAHEAEDEVPKVCGWLGAGSWASLPLSCGCELCTCMLGCCD